MVGQDITKTSPLSVPPDSETRAAHQPEPIDNFSSAQFAGPQAFQPIITEDVAR
jgi:hypothetical protein